MYIIEVAPLVRGVGLSHLSYYSQVAYPIGTLLTIPVRRKEVRGLVISTKPVSAARAAVRAATFSLRRLPVEERPQILSPLLVETAKELQKKVPASFGAILFALLPEEVRSGEDALPSSAVASTCFIEDPISVLTAERSDRFVIYKRRIREAFAHRGSVVFVSPLAETMSQAAEELLSGIVERSVVFSGDLTKRGRAKAYKEVNDLSISKLILTTPSRGFIDRPDITDVIIDESGSGHYRSRLRPYLDLKEALITHSRLACRRVLLGDIVHRSEDEYLRRIEMYDTEAEAPHRINLGSQLRVIEQKDKPSADTPFKLLSDQLLSALTLAEKNKKNFFLYSARRGLSPVVACGDCGFIFRCPDSGTPYSLFRTQENGEEKRWFLSSVSGRRVRAQDTCPECGSWRLRERGIGIQHIEDELKKHFKAEKIFVFDHHTASTAGKAHSIIGDFYAKKGAILLGTSMALPYLQKPISFSAIVSLDAVRSAPTWRADEDSFSLLLRLREKTDEILFVQSRTEEDDFLTLAKSGQIDQFFGEELKLREEMRYPPFNVLIHLKMSGPADAVQELEALVKEKLSLFEFTFYSGPESIRSQTVRYGLCRVAKEKWPNAELVNSLRELPPSVRIEINPDRLV